MVHIPIRPAKGKKHYRVYKEAKGEVKTKARLLKEALRIAHEKDEHVKEIDFIPGKFTLQLHGWFNPGIWNNIGECERFLKKVLKEGKDPVKEFEKKGGKFHYDLRTKKKTAPSWFGLTPFRAPWTGTPENKVMGTVKGYQVITPGGKVLQKFLAEVAEKAMAKEGIAERRDRIEWMKIKAQWFKPDSPGNPQKDQPAIMIAIEFYKPACIHRRELDFFDITYFGDYLKGRYYNRLVERKIATDELTEWQKQDIKKKKAAAFYNLSFYFWKAKDQWGDPGTPYTMKEVHQAALGTKTLAKVAAPKKKKPKKVKEIKELKPPEATKEFH
ncbi:hypothetical protein KAW50_02570 [candidate division WOR-3 bacterium]|nr:hypothetical protein [candidate division WOR-3 bacterium]